MYRLLWPLWGLFFHWEIFTGPRLVPARVSRVLDGDTVVLASGRHVRLAGVDAPELGQPTRSPQKDAGVFARRCLEHILAPSKRQVRIRIQGQDIYRRTLGALFLPDGTAVDEELLVRGCAVVYRYGRGERRALLRLEAEAKKKRQGLWRLGGIMDPGAYRRKLRRRGAGR